MTVPMHVSWRDEHALDLAEAGDNLPSERTLSPAIMAAPLTWPGQSGGGGSRAAVG